MTDQRNCIEVGPGSDRRNIAVARRLGAAPGLMWLGGFKSDMGGTKAIALDLWAEQQGRACVRFDYSGHGASGGAFTDGTISRWLEESLAVFEACCEGPQILVGSSMGGWLALLLSAQVLRRGLGAPAKITAPTLGKNQQPGKENGPATDSIILAGTPTGPATIAALVLIAPAVDFTEELMWKRFPAAAKQAISTAGAWLRPSSYAEEPYPITRALIEDGRRHLLLGGLIETGCPVRILQGVQDPDVPWRHAVDLVSRLAQDDVVLSLIKDGDHRLSRPEDIERLIATISEFDGIAAPA